ncbi:hypothetical protein ERJ75_000741300 [Trypanosoma vivax]|nr:hypothetical protein ERJ75_000741600 [Trypanosoma vivax]KAH8614174.1 hypothetical protein ERJ75_000741300 [Trypanosoma vivax]
MAKPPCAPAKGEGRVKAPRPLFNEGSVSGRARVTRADAEEEQWQLPLQKVGVGTLSPEWAGCRLGNRAPKRFDAAWRYVLQMPEPHSSKCEPQLRIDEADAGEMERAGAIFEASQ